MEIAFGIAASDPGANAVDDKDGDISNKIVSDWNTKVNVNKEGTYNVTYSVSDNAGNSSSQIRTVTIKYLASGFYREYNSVFTNGGTSSGVFTSTITPGDNPNQFVIYPFRGGKEIMASQL